MAELISQRDEPGTLREYETIFILRPMANSDQIQDVNSRVRRVIEDAGGKVLRLDNWGKRKLAYEIRKQLKGIYLYWLFLGSAGMVAEIERNLRMVDLVIRYFTVAVDEDVFPDARPSAVDDESFAAAATIVPDEEDAYMGRTFEEEEAEGKSAEGKPAEGKPAEGKPAEDKPAEDKPAEATAEDKPAEAAAEDKPAEGKPAEDKPAEDKPAEPAAAPAAEEKPAEKAAEPAADEKKKEEE